MHSMPASASRRSRDSGFTTTNSSWRVAVGLNCPRARAHLSKNSRMSATRSRTTGMLASGPISTRPALATLSTCVRQVQRGVPFTVMAQEPHIPTRHAKR